jgi:hypothetical protein
MDEWAGRLAQAYAACRGTHPEDTALVVVGGGALVDGGGRPRAGVVDMVRVFGIQPLTGVAVVWDRAGEADLGFEPEVVRRRDGDRDLVGFWRATLRDLRRDGHRIAAIVHQEVELVDALNGDGHGDSGDDDGTVAVCLPAGTRGADEPHEPHEPVELVWHRVNAPMVLRQFLVSPIRWAEVDLRFDERDRLVVHHGDIGAADGSGAGMTTADEVFDRFRAAGKGINLDVKDPNALGATLDAVADHGFPDEDVWGNGRIDQLGEDGLRSVKTRFPGSRLQVPLEFLGQVAATMPDEARRIVDRIRSWGVDRFSLAWTHPDTPMLRDRLDEWGAETNLYAITDLEQFLAAVLTVPRSLTADFTLPEWHYFGRGAGNDGRFHRDPHEAAKDPPGIDIA